MSSVSVPVIDDKLLEGENETFDLILIVPSSLGPAITAGDKNRTEGVIIDTTSKHKYYHVLLASYIAQYQCHVAIAL